MSVTPEHPIKRRCDVGPDEEFRAGPTANWTSPSKTASPNFDTYWVEVRPARQPDPKWFAGWHDVVSDHGFGVTTMGEMKGRVDLDEWQYADAPDGLWWDWYVIRHSVESYPDDFPVILRRKP